MREASLETETPTAENRTAGRHGRSQAAAERQFWFWAVGTGLGVLGLVGGQALLFWLNHEDWFARLEPGFRWRLLLFLGLAVVSLLATLWYLLRYFFRRYVFSIYRLAEDLEVLLSGSPAAVLSAGEEGLGPLERALNELVERHQGAEAHVEERLEAALGSLLADKTRLESILEALQEGVVVCTLDGTVLHYNRAAARLLDHKHYLGEGRSLFRLMDKALCEYAVETLHGQIASEVPHPVVQFSMPREGLGDLRVRVAPLHGELTQLHGFVLTLEDPAVAAPSLQPPPRAAAPALEPLPGPPLAPADARLDALRLVVFDTETTGLQPAKGDEIISVGAVVVLKGRLLRNETFDQLVNPGRPLSPASINVHGIRPEMLAGQPPIGEVLDAFARFCEGGVLVAHNAAFDMRFLRKGEPAGGRFDQPVLDTLLLSAVLHPHQSSHSLDTLVRRYGIREEGRHTALGDALMTAELLLKMLPLLAERDIHTLSEALAASRHTPLSRLTY